MTEAVVAEPTRKYSTEDFFDFWGKLFNSKDELFKYKYIISRREQIQRLYCQPEPSLPDENPYPDWVEEMMACPPGIRVLVINDNRKVKVGGNFSGKFGMLEYVTVKETVDEDGTLDSKNIVYQGVSVTEAVKKFQETYNNSLLPIFRIRGEDYDAVRESFPKGEIPEKVVKVFKYYQHELKETPKISQIDSVTWNVVSGPQEFTLEDCGFEFVVNYKDINAVGIRINNIYFMLDEIADLKEVEEQTKIAVAEKPEDDLPQLVVFRYARYQVLIKLVDKHTNKPIPGKEIFGIQCQWTPSSPDIRKFKRKALRGARKEIGKVREEYKKDLEIVKRRIERKRRRKGLSNVSDRIETNQ